MGSDGGPAGVGLPNGQSTIANDANGNLLKQLIHGDLGYDDPIEVTTVDSSVVVGPGQSQPLTRLYPVYDEAGGGTWHVNDQAICIGWAGYDAKTSFRPPEHFLAHQFRIALEESIDRGELAGEGPDGKLLVRIREEGQSWTLEHLLVTLQQRETTDSCS